MEIITIFEDNGKMYRKEKKHSQDPFFKVSKMHRTYINAIEC